MTKKPLSEKAKQAMREVFGDMTDQQMKDKMKEVIEFVQKKKKKAEERKRKEELFRNALGMRLKKPKE